MKAILALLLLCIAGSPCADEVPAQGQGLKSRSPAGPRCTSVHPEVPMALMTDLAFKSATVVVEYEVVPPGDVASVVIKKSSGHVEWERAVLEAAKGIKCNLGTPVTAPFFARQEFALHPDRTDTSLRPQAHWCPPGGPKLPAVLPADNPLMLKPGWVTLRMHVRPGAAPVTNVRVISEAGGPMHARTWIPLVRQWVGCTSNEVEVDFDMKFTHGYIGSQMRPEREAFGPHAFKQPRGAPKLPAGDWGIGVCPISATLLLRQSDAPNVVRDLESKGGTPVREWLEGLVPDRDYMIPSPDGNRIEFDCRVAGGEVVFYDR